MAGAFIQDPSSIAAGRDLVHPPQMDLAESIDSSLNADDADAEPADAAGWQQFVEREIASSRGAYVLKPEFMLGHFRAERQTAGDYAGRELLELVQNAADAAMEVGGGGRVRVEISRQGLLVANTGQGFRKGGVRSLMTVHASDKPGRKAKLIGAKGLGFRALLNWSGQPIVSSGTLEIAFSAERAAAVVEGMAANDAGIARICDGEEKTPVPILAFPAIGNILDRHVKGSALALLTRARELRANGFDTVVAAPFDHTQSFDRSLKQASEFTPTFLLFVEALAEIEILVEGMPPIRWSRTSRGIDKYDLDVDVGGATSRQSWICRRSQGGLPATKGRPSGNFELAYALRTDIPNSSGLLHSYFPTSIPLPFPGVFHATLELDSNRKAFGANSDVNELVLGELAKFFAASVADLTKSGTIKNALDFLTRSDRFSDALQAFEAAVYREARTLPLVPTLRGGRAPAAIIQVGPADYEKYLSTRMFGRLAKCRDRGERETLGRLGVETLAPAAVVKILVKADLTIEERARAIVGIASALEAKYHDRRLLLDQRQRPLRSINTAFPPSVAGKRLPVLPNWARAKFILPELWQAIVRRAEGKTLGDKVRSLAGFGISEYSADSVMASVRAQASAALSRRRQDADEIQRDLLRTLHQLYAPSNRQPTGAINVRCRDGRWRDAREAHLSAEYGVIGRINEALFWTMPGYLVAGAELNGLDPAEENLSEFLLWLGVHRWPRAETGPVPIALRPEVLKALPETISVHDATYRQLLKRSDIVWGQNFQVDCSMIVGLEKILSTAESDAILAWLAFDKRFDPAAPYTFVTSGKGRKNSSANFRPFGEPLPDMVRVAIAHSPWLACRDGGRHPPRDTMIHPGSLAEIFNVPRPAVLESEQKFGLTQQLWRRGLEHARVPYGLSDLTTKQVISLLHTLCDRNLRAEIVRRLYLQILELEHFETKDAAAEIQTFLANGRVQVHRRHVREWVAPHRALYADNSSFPLAAREHLALIDLPPRRNSGDVLARFGVQALGKQDFALAITQVEEETGHLALLLKAALDGARPYVRALRRANSNDTARLRKFDALRLRIARSAAIEVTISGEKIAATLEPWTHVLQGDLLTVAIEAHRQPTQLAALAHEAIADGIAEFFDIQGGAEFLKLLSADDAELRRLLLLRMLPNMADEEIDELLVEAGAAEEDYEPVRVDPAMLALGPSPPSRPPPPQNGSPPVPDLAASTTDIAYPAKPAALDALKLPTANVGTTWPVGTTMPTSPGIRVAGVTGPIAGTANHDPSRASDAESWALMFELSEGRFPLDVAHLQGRDAYGCDCLSFKTKEDLELFKANPMQTELVARFVETKSGTVHLTTSEVAAAVKRADRYFIYRVEFYSGARDFAELTIVKNPLSQTSSLVTQCELRIDTVASRERYRLTPADFAPPTT